MKTGRCLFWPSILAFRRNFWIHSRSFVKKQKIGFLLFRRSPWLRLMTTLGYSWLILTTLWILLTNLVYSSTNLWLPFNYPWLLLTTLDYLILLASTPVCRWLAFNAKPTSLRVFTFCPGVNVFRKKSLECWRKKETTFSAILATHAEVCALHADFFWILKTVLKIFFWLNQNSNQITNQFKNEHRINSWQSSFLHLNPVFFVSVLPFWGTESLSRKIWYTCPRP